MHATSSSPYRDLLGAILHIQSLIPQAIHEAVRVTAYHNTLQLLRPSPIQVLDELNVP